MHDNEQPCEMNVELGGAYDSTFDLLYYRLYFYLWIFHLVRDLYSY